MIGIRQMTEDDIIIFIKWLYTPHVAKWYHDPLDWIAEVEDEKNEFGWIHHYIVEYDDVPIGFCQYYACKDSDEDWGGYTQMCGSYSIDYMIGETEFIGKGIGKEIVNELTDMIKAHPDAKRIVVQPEAENKASCGLLKSCGFDYDEKNDMYISEILSESI